MISLKDFELVERRPDGRVISFQARHRRTGALLLAHLFQNQAMGEGRQVLALLPTLPPRERSRILDFGQDQQGIFFITEDLPGGRTFRQWLAAASQPASLFNTAPGLPAEAPLRLPPSPGGRPHRQPEGEFTRNYSGAAAGSAAANTGRRPREFEPAPDAFTDSGATTTAEFLDFYNQRPSVEEVESPALAPPTVRQRAPETDRGPLGWLVPGGPAAAPPPPAAPPPGGNPGFQPLFTGGETRRRAATPLLPQFRAVQDAPMVLPPRPPRVPPPQSARVDWRRAVRHWAGEMRPFWSSWLAPALVVLGTAILVVVVATYLRS